MQFIDHMPSYTTGRASWYARTATTEENGSTNVECRLLRKSIVKVELLTEADFPRGLDSHPT